jgi:hypothetical protein
MLWLKRRLLQASLLQALVSGSMEMLDRRRGPGQAALDPECRAGCDRLAPKLSGAFFANIDVHLWHFIRCNDCRDLQIREQLGWGHPQAQTGTFGSEA